MTYLLQPSESPHASRHQDVQSALDNYGRCEFAPGRYLFDHWFLLRGKNASIRSADPNDPAILVRGNATDDICRIATENSWTKELFGDVDGTRISDLIFDFQGWTHAYHALIRFWGGKGHIRDTKIDNCQVIDSNFTGRPSKQQINGVGDRTFISLAAYGHNSGLIISDCHDTAPNSQFTQNGGSGWQNVLLKRIYKRHGQANAIAFSTREDDVSFVDLRFEDIVLFDVYDVGVFLGADASISTTVNIRASFNNISIHFARRPDVNDRIAYQSGLLLKAGNETTVCQLIARNVFIDGSDLVPERDVLRTVQVTKAVVPETPDRPGDRIELDHVNTNYSRKHCIIRGVGNVARKSSQLTYSWS